MGPSQCCLVERVLPVLPRDCAMSFGYCTDGWGPHPLVLYSVPRWALHITWICFRCRGLVESQLLVAELLGQILCLLLISTNVSNLPLEIVSTVRAGSLLLFPGVGYPTVFESLIIPLAPAVCPPPGTAPPMSNKSEL